MKITDFFADVIKAPEIFLSGFSKLFETVYVRT